MICYHQKRREKYEEKWIAAMMAAAIAFTGLAGCGSKDSNGEGKAETAKTARK